MKQKREELRKSLANGAAGAAPAGAAPAREPAAARMGPGAAALVAAADEEMGTFEAITTFQLAGWLTFARTLCSACVIHV